MGGMKRARGSWRRGAALAAALLLTAGVLSCGADYGGLGRAADAVPFMPEAATGVLPSGLRYYLLENSLPQGRAFLTLAVDAGSVLETEDERGLAHFVEHMAFNGTERFPKQALLDYLRSLGMRFGADANAYTSYDETVYGIEVPVEVRDGVKRVPDRALEIIDDWTRAITFDEGETDNERKVVLEELRARLGAQDRVRKRLLPVIFRGSPYAEREPIGLAEIIGSAGADALRGFYRKWYRPENMAVIIVGDFDGRALEASLAERFTIAADGERFERPRYELPPPEKGNFHVEVITDPELTSTDFSVYYKRRADRARGSLASYRDSVIDNLIDTMLTLRFDEAASKSETSYAQAWAGPWGFGRSGRFYALGVQAKNGLAGEALRELLLEKEAVVRYGFTASELKQAKARLVSALERLVSEKDRQQSSGYVRELTAHFIDGEDAPGVEWELDAVNRLLPGIGRRDILAVARGYFAGGDCTVFVTAPETEVLPSPERVREVFAETARAKIAPRKDAAASGGLVETEPEPGAVVSESRDEESGAVLWELSNGARVILKATENRNNEVILLATARGGTTSVSGEEAVSAELAPEMLSASGLGPYDRAELTRKLAGKQAALSSFASHYYRGFEGSSTTKDLKTLFEMLYLEFTQPEIREDAVKALADQYRANLANQEDDPETVFSHEIIKLRSNNHPRFKPLEAADIDTISLDRARAFVRRCFNPADYVFVFTGNMGLDETRGLVRTWLASIPAQEGAWNEWKDLGEGLPGGAEKTVRKGRDERAMVYLGWFGRADYSEERSQTAALLTEYLDITLTEEIREALGGVYSITPSAAATPIPQGTQSLQVFFYCAPERVEELSAAVRERLAGIAGGAVSGDVLAKAREALLKEHEKNMQSNRYIAQSLANSAALLRLPLARLTRRPQVIKALTAADIQRLCRSLLASGPAKVTLYPEAGEK
ncbi:MAG: insulinase family protein [Treponematales bacterium]